ncbi:MAG: alpha/beta hydrolase [Betaproteobacteria bacterium]
MHYIQAGQGNPPIVFVHGFACTHEDWQQQLDFFAPTHAVVACDLRGHGDSPGDATDCSIENYGADVAALMGELKYPPAILVGHSMGCRAVLQAYLYAPERVCGIVLVDGSRLGFGDPVVAERVMNEQLRATGYGVFARRLFDEMFIVSSDPKLKATLMDRALQVRSEIGSTLFPRLVGWDARRMEAALAAVRVPLMIVQSTTMSAERIRVSLSANQSSPWLDLVKARAPGARIEIVPGSGHFPQLEAPEKVNALLADFAAGLA